MHYRVVGAAIWSPVSPVSPRISKPWRPSVTTFTFGRRDKRGIIIRRTRPEYRECNNLVWLVLRFCHATHSTASPLLALAVLDVNTKTEMFLLMLKHPAAGLAPIPSLLVNWEPGRKIKFLSLIYLRQNCNPTQYNTVQICKLLDLVVWKKLVQWVYIIIVWSQAWLAWASIFVVTFNKQIKLAPVLRLTVTNTHFTHSTASLSLLI